MNEEKNIKCEKCGQEMIKGEPFLHVKEEGQRVHKDSVNVCYCDSQTCENRNKVIRLIAS